jgi:hypothetical protein
LRLKSRKSHARTRAQGALQRVKSARINRATGVEGRAMPSLLNPVLSNWAAVVAMWALPYLTLRHHLGLETTDALQWSLVAVSVFGTARVLYVAWRVSRDRAWRASHGLLAPRRAN